MAKINEDDIKPCIRLDVPTQRLDPATGEQEAWKQNTDASSAPKVEKHAQAPLDPRRDKLRPTPLSWKDNIHRGSYQKSHASRRSSRAASSIGTRPSSSRQSLSQMQLDILFAGQASNLDTFDIEEFRDGFFDAIFLRPAKHDEEEMHAKAMDSLPRSFRLTRPQFTWGFVRQEWQSFISVMKETSTASAIKLSKSVLGIFLAYLVCLIPVTRAWLGRYSYMMVISAIINHPGRSIGAQIDGTIFTCLGMGVGLAWGSLSLFVSFSTLKAQKGYGGIVATFLLLFTLSVSWLRSVFIHFYQGVIAAGIAIVYVSLANSSEGLSASKIMSFVVPWLLGQALCLAIASLIFPSAGSRPLAISLHSCLNTIEARLMSCDLLNQPVVKRKLAWHFVDLSTAVRDFTIELSISRYRPEDIRTLRNLVQGAIRAVLPMKIPCPFLDYMSSNLSAESLALRPSPDRNDSGSLEAVEAVQIILGVPCRNLQLALQEAILRVDAVLMDLSGHRKDLGPSMVVSSNMNETASLVRQGMACFDDADKSLEDNPNMPNICSEHPQAVEILLFAHCLRQTADKILQLLEHCTKMQQGGSHLRFNLPSYGLKKSLLRTNGQVRHDRGGMTAAVYFHSKAQLDKIMRELQGREYVPQGHRNHPIDPIEEHVHVENSGASDSDTYVPSSQGKRNKGATFRYSLWKILHRLQGLESRFAFKMTLVIGLCSVPAWISASRTWWDENESWWAVITVWVLMQPRVGGNVQDLFVRATTAALGALCGGITFAAGNGNPYVMAVLGLVFWIPILYRYTQGDHPRSGVIGCLSFTVVSLSMVTNQDWHSTVYIAWTRGLAFVAGVVAALVVNWVLWPFVARHELRKSVSAMLLHSAILYRGTMAKYVYYTEGNQPDAGDVARSELLEGRLREGFVRARQLMELTRHEIRLKAPFDSLPYSALIQSLEDFFENLIQVRQSSLYFLPHMLAGTEKKGAETLLPIRRDAIASILMNLYAFASALRSGRPVPRYLPSAAASRQRLLDKMADLEDEERISSRGLLTKPGESRRWADVYYEAYTAALTDIVEELQVLEYFTKQICGEVGFDADMHC